VRRDLYRRGRLCGRGEHEQKKESDPFHE
jgi:hypothetical protein